MFDIFIFPVVGGVVFAVTKLMKQKNKKDYRIIQQVFKNRKLAVKQNDYLSYPKLVNKRIGQGLFDSYIYMMPLGISYNEFFKIKDAIQDTLGKEINITSAGKQVVRIQVARNALPTKIPLVPLLELTKGWNIILGVSSFGIVTHNFDHHPHITGGGTTRYGKTVFLKNIVTQLILQNPESVNLYIIDLKGGLEFVRFSNLKQVKAIASNPDETHKMLLNIEYDILNNQQYFKKNYFTNIVDTKIKERTFVIVDEGAILAKVSSMQKSEKDLLDECQRILSFIAAQGGALGYRLIMFSQYPTADTLPRQIKQNADTKVGFYLPTEIASQVVIDQSGCETLPRVKGRMVVKSDVLSICQVPFHDNHMELLAKYRKEDVNESSPIFEEEKRRNIVDFG